MRPAKPVLLLVLGLVVMFSLSGCFFKKRSTTIPPLSRGLGAIQGVVRSPDGVPLSDVQVSVQGTSLTATTGVGGSFEVEGAPAGKVSLSFTKRNFLTTVRPFEVSGLGTMAAEVTLAPLDSSLHNGLLAVNGYTGKCATCHVAHKDNPSLLTYATVNNTCFTCHNGVNRGVARSTYEATGHSPTQPTNSPTLKAWTGMQESERGYCSTCHDPHGVSGTRAMLKGGDTLDSNLVCEECHASDGAGNTARWPGKDAYNLGTNLHGNPPLPGNGTLRTYPTPDPGNPAKSYSAGECLNCHTPHGTPDGGSVTPAMTRNKAEKLCMKCHTAFQSRIPDGTAVRHKCSMCHNPHLVEAGNKWLIAPGSDKTQQTTDSKKSVYRGQTRLSNEYCLGCHNTNAGNPYRTVAPIPQNSVFKDGRWLATQWQYDLHDVHVYKIGYGGGYIGDHGDSYVVRGNNLRCVDCHDVHPRVGVSGRGRLLRSDVITSITLTNGKYQGKAGCGTAYPCHYDSSLGTYQGRSCDWCHSTTGFGVGEPGWGCTSDHGYSYHPTTMP